MKRWNWAGTWFKYCKCNNNTCVTNTRRHNQSIKKLYYTTYVVKLFMCHSHWLSVSSISSDKMRASSLAVTQQSTPQNGSFRSCWTFANPAVSNDSLAWKCCIMLIAWRRLVSDSIDLSGDLIRAVIAIGRWLDTWPTSQCWTHSTQSTLAPVQTSCQARLRWSDLRLRLRRNTTLTLTKQSRVSVLAK